MPFCRVEVRRRHNKGTGCAVTVSAQICGIDDPVTHHESNNEVEERVDRTSDVKTVLGIFTVAWLHMVPEFMYRSTDQPVSHSVCL